MLSILLTINLMTENKNYNHKVTLYNPTIISGVLLIVAVGLIFLILQSDSLRNILFQSVQKVTQLMSN